MKKIKPLPMLFKVTTEELKNALFEYFKEAGVPTEGVRYIIKRKENRIELSAQVAINVNSKFIETEKSAQLTTIGFENPYKMSNELIKILVPNLIRKNSKITTNILESKQGSRKIKRFIIELDPIKTLNFILEQPPEGYGYNIVGAISQKNNSQLQISLEKKKNKNKRNK